MTLAVYIPLLSGAPVTRGTCINSVLYRAMAKLQRAGTTALEIRYARIESIACRKAACAEAAGGHCWEKHKFRGWRCAVFW